ncbi:MAG: peptidoglycan-binding domain-containing protein [bacterium]|nr:peptidoglycan-binding domain-containing protein [bacterium]
MSKALATKNVAAVLLAVTMVIGFAFAFATPAKADVISDLQAQIQSLLAQISALQGGTGSQQVGGLSCNTFTRSHQQGDSGGEVMWIQQFLNSVDGTQVATTGAGSPGNETSFFGGLTRAAVSKFQQKYGITPTAGYWGPISRAKANALCAEAPAPGPGPGPTPGPVTGNLNVAAGAQPANSLAPTSAMRVPFTTFTLTNGSNTVVTVTGVVVQRTGLSNDAVFAGLVLIDANTNVQIGVQRTLNSNHQATVGDTISLNPGETRTLTVAGNMATSLTSYAGQIVGISVVGINTTATVSGSLPITGAQQTVNSTLTIGTVSTSTSSYNPGGTSSKNIGDTNIKFSGLRFTAPSSEDVKLYSIRWRQVGTVSSADLANVMTYIDGTAYPTSVSSDGKYYTTVFAGGILVTKGNSLDTYIQGDIIGTNAASRTVDFSIDRESDVFFIGQTYGYGMDLTNGASSDWFDGYAVTVTAGTVTTIGKASEVPAQNVALNLQGQVLGGFVTDIKGEPISVQQIIISVATSGAGVGVITNASIYNASGVVVAGPVDANTAGTSLTFTDTVTFPVGRQVYTIKGKLASGMTNGGTVILSTTPSSQWTTVTGQTTGNTISLSSNGAFNMNTMTIRAASLQVAVSSSPATSTIVTGGQGTLFTNYQFDASQSGEDVKFTSLVIDYNGGTQTLAANQNMVSSCQLWDGSVALNTGSNVLNPASTATTTGGTNNTVTLDNSLTVTKGTIKTLAFKCNVSSNANDASQIQWGISNANIIAIAATGLTSGSSVTPEAVTAGVGYNGNLMTIGSGTLVASLDSSSPSYAIGAGGTNVTLGAYKLRAANENVNLNKIGLKLTNTASSSAADLVTVTLHTASAVSATNPTGQIGTATFAGASTSAQVMLGTPITITKDADTVVTVKGDLATISGSGAGAPGTPGHLIAVDVDTTGAKTQGTGAGSGTTITGTGTTAVSGVRLQKTYPTVALETLPSPGVVDQRLLRFKVTANGASPLGIAKFVLSISTTSVNLAGFDIFCYTNSDYSGPCSGVSSDGGFLATDLTGADWAAATSQLEFPAQTSAGASSTVQVPAGGTRYFEARASTVGGIGTSFSANTTLQGDTAYPVLPGFMAAAGSGTSADDSITFGANNDFIWSPNSTTTAAWVDADWTNGYGVPGLSANGISQNRTQ